ncbi:MAG: uracil phosphoribosyltransferase [Gemmatimonadales bacterium]|nr:uracil phosphoribosyltransferase [Gemmatimonadales bacterium]
MTTDRSNGLLVLDHPLIRHKLALLRDTSTTSRDFKQLVGEIAALMTYEVTRDLPTVAIEVQTPLELTRGEKIATGIALVPILRAGLGMVESIVQLIPNARVGHIGLYRDPDSLEPVSYYFKVPTPVADYRFFLLDPMLATGGSAAEAADELKRAGASDISLLSLVAAPEGVATFRARHPDIPVTVAALDRALNDHGYILPGLGDAGDRIFGTR